MATTTLVSLAEYLSTTYEPDVEYVHGVIEERQVGESRLSSGLRRSGSSPTTELIS